MAQPTDDLKRLIDRGKKQGHLTWAEAKAALGPDGGPDQLDKLLRALEDAGVELIDED